MRVGRIIGTVTLNRWHPSFQGARLKLAAPLSLDQLLGKDPGEGECLVLWDELGAGMDSLVAISDGAEAAQPFRPEIKPVDAYNAAILDEVEISDPAEVE
ncbi:MAG: carbon dioxide concentrating mechanism protein CcmL [Pirellulaceae bacterium]|nr:carbon dioxide concentrating mechanism protein CcmL [Pirellulaceae bacterium]